MYYTESNTTQKQKMAISIINHIQLRIDTNTQHKKYVGKFELAYIDAMEDGLAISQSLIADKAKLALSKVIADYRELIDDSKNSTWQLSTG